MIIVPIIELVFIIVSISFFVAWYNNYKKYYEYMAENHKDIFLKIIKRDPLVSDVGDWIRWPVGSGYIIISSFLKNEYYGDNIVKNFKNRSVIYIIGLVIFFFLALVLPTLVN